MNLLESPLSYPTYLRLQSQLRQRRQELLLFCSHPAVITYGRQALQKNLLTDTRALDQLGIACYAVKRGGDFTAHETGQCVIYPHVDLKKRGIKLSPFARAIVDTTRQALKFIWPQLDLQYRNDAPGLYIKDSNTKLAAVGFSFEKFFSSHGIAINIHNDLRTFQLIRPCGYQNIHPISIRQLDLPAPPTLTKEFCRTWQKLFEAWLSKAS